MIHSVSKEMITVIQCVPRIAERTTPAIAAQLKVNNHTLKKSHKTCFPYSFGSTQLPSFEQAQSALY